MSEKNLPLSFNVQVYGELEKYNATISKARVRIFYRGLNRNYSYITDEFAEELIKTLPYTPIKAIYDENSEDFTDHGTGAKSLGRAYGVVPENGNGAWERHIDSDGIERTYYCTDVLLWTSLYENAKKIPGKCQSMELFEPSIEGSWKIFDNGVEAYEFSHGCFLGLQVLGSINGDKVEPCFEGSAFYSLKEQFNDIINVVKNYNLQEDKSMQDNVQATEPIVDNALEVTEIAENTVETIAENTVAEPVIKNSVVTETEETVQESTEPATELIVENSIAEETVTENTITEDFEAKYTATLTELNELKEKFSKLSDEFSVLQGQFNDIKVERDALQEFKSKTETAEKNEVINKYTAILSEDTIKTFKERMSEFTALELDKELCFEAHKNDIPEDKIADYSYKGETEEESAIQKYLNNYKTN